MNKHTVLRLVIWTTLALISLHAAADPGSSAAVAREYRQAHEQQLIDEFVALLSLPNVATDGVAIRKNAEYIADLLVRFEQMGLQVHVHAVGDAGIRMALDGFEAARRINGETGLRHHIVHLQLMNDADAPRFAELNVSATFQSLWAWPDPSVLELDVPILGEARAWSMYNIGTVHRSGGRIVGGSDFFVTDLNPLLAIEAAVTRQNPYENTGPVLDEDERVDLATMIDAYTVNGAYLMGLDDRQGSIETGKRADFVVLDRNLFEIPSADISDAKVVMTVFGGEDVYN